MRSFAYVALLGVAAACSGFESEELRAAASAETIAPEVFVLKLPAEVATTDVRSSNMTRDMIVFMARYFVTDVAGVRVEPASVRIPRTSVPDDVAPFYVRAAAAETHSGAVTALREALLASCGDVSCYAKYRGSRHDGCVVPSTVPELASFTGNYRATWERTAVAPSRVKGKARVFYRDARGLLPGCTMVIAETLSTEADAAEAEVRETEVIQKRTDGSADWDYFAFDASGAFASRSTFFSGRGATVEGPVPFTCMGCHYDRDGRALQNKPLSWHP